MSGPVVEAVWLLDLEAHEGVGAPTQKLVLLALAKYADIRGGSMFPSHSRIAARTALSGRAVRYAVRALAQQGVIEPDGPVLDGRVRRWRMGKWYVPDRNWVPVNPGTTFRGPRQEVPGTPAPGATDFELSVSGNKDLAETGMQVHPEAAARTRAIREELEARMGADQLADLKRAKARERRAAAAKERRDSREAERGS